MLTEVKAAHFATDMSSDFYSRLRAILNDDSHHFYHLHLFQDHRIPVDTEIRSIRSWSKFGLAVRLVMFLIFNSGWYEKLYFHSIFPYLLVFMFVGKKAIFIHRASDYLFLKKKRFRILLRIYTFFGAKIVFKTEVGRRRIERIVQRNIEVKQYLFNPLRDDFLYLDRQPTRILSQVAFNVLILSEEHSRKGLAPACEALARFSEVSSRPVSVRHFGSLDRGEVVKQCGSFNSEKFNYTHYTRLLDAKNVKLLMGNSDLVILPSIDETFGIVYVEALAVGCPVVGVRNHGLCGTEPLAKQITFAESQSPLDILAAVEVSQKKTIDSQVVLESFDNESIRQRWRDA